MPRVSIVLPTYNRVSSLKRALDSVLSQNYSDFELIVVDNNSTDDTIDFLESLKDPRIKIISYTSAQGAGVARNAGISRASGEYLAFQDSDDEWLPGKLKKQVEILDQESSIGAVYSPYILQHLNGKQTQIPKAVDSRMSGDVRQRFLEEPLVGTPTLIVRKVFLDSINGFDPRLKTLEDWELAIRLSQVTKFFCLRTPTVRAFETPESVSSSTELMLTTMEKILKMHRDLYQDYPEAESKVLTFIGNRYCLAGKMQLGRSYFLKALKTFSKNKLAVAGLICSFGGNLFYKKLRQIAL